MDIRAVHLTLPVVQSPPQHEIGPQNELANNQPIQLTKEKWLDEAMAFFKEKTTADKAKKGKTTKGKTKKGTKVPVKEYLKMLEQLDSSKSKYKELHPLERYLKLGLEHEELLKEQERHAELMFRKDLREQYHYEPYYEVVQNLKTFIAQKNWNLLPEFNVLDPQSKTRQTPQQYGNNCKNIMKNLFDQRYAFVKPYLSSYHQTLIKRNNCSTLYNLMNNRIRIALTKKPGFEASTSPKCVEYGNPLTEQANLPTSGAPFNLLQTQKRDCTNVADISSNSNKSDASQKRRKTDRHSSEGEQEVTVVQRLIRPSPSPTLPNFSFLESMMEHNQHHDPLNLVLKQKLNHVCDATKSHPYNNSIGESNEMPVSADHLRIAMLQALYSNCSNDVSCLIASVGNGASGSGKGLFTRACESAMKRECTQGVPCKSYRNVVDIMCDWVVQDQNEVDIVSLVTQFETHELNGDPNMTQNARIEYHATNAANDMMAIWQYRAAVVDEFLSPIERPWLNKIVQKAKITFKLHAVAELLKHVSQDGIRVNSTSQPFWEIEDSFPMNPDILEEHLRMS